MGDKDKNSNFIETMQKAIIEKCLEKYENGVPEQEIIDKVKKLNANEMDEIYASYINDTAEEMLKFYQTTMYEEALRWNAETAEFIAIQEQKWGRCFVASRAMYTISVEAAEKYGKYLNGADMPDKNNKKYRYLVLREIHGRTCQIFLEILHLMQLGFADGAFARWRSMYELSVVANFIYDGTEDTAKAFHGASETDDRYEWARCAPCFSQNAKKHITFNDIQNQCDFTNEIWKKQYTLANQIVHASPQGTFKRISIKEPLGMIPVGHSDYGISTPAEHSAISLSQVSALFFTLLPYDEGLVAVEVLNRWGDLVRKYYFDTHDEIFREH